MSGARIGELLPANREEGPGRPITIRPGEMISGRHRQAEHSQACVGHQSGFVDDRAVAPRYWRPREPGPIRSWPPTALPSDHFPGQTAPTTPRRPLHLSSGNNIKSRPGRFQLAEFSCMEVTL